MDFDVNTLRIGVTVTGFALFIALVVHSWSRRRLTDHAAAAMLPFVGEEAAGAGAPTAPQPVSGERA